MNNKTNPVAETRACPHLGKQFNPLDSTQLATPYPIFAQARKEEPIFFSDQMHAWVVTRYDDVKAIVSRPTVFSSRDTIRPMVAFAPEVYSVLSTGYQFALTATNADGKEHRRLRIPLRSAFSSARVRAMEGFIRATALRLIQEMYQGGESDLLKAFAAPFTLEVLLAIFGITSEDMSTVKGYCDQFLTLLFQPFDLSNEQEVARQVMCARGTIAFQNYCVQLAEVRKTVPREDFVGDLVAEHTAGNLTIEELIMSLAGTLIAGYETTMNLIGNALALLLEQPERWEHLCSDPDLIPSVVEEVLRFETSLPYYIRTAARDATVGKVAMREGDLILLAYASANHDEQHFPDTEQFVMNRFPNEHLAFGAGSHFCPGSALARQEVIIALEELCVAFPSLRLRERQQLEKHIQSLRIRGLQRLDGVW